MTRFVGIDPGLSGAIAVLDGDGQIVWVEDMPTEPKFGIVRNKKRQVAAPVVFALLALAGTGYAMVERQSARPGQGVVSIFSLGDTFGVLRTACAVRFPFVRYPTPQTWRKEFGLMGGGGKGTHLDLARTMWPTYNGLTRKKDHDRADALLLAEYCRRIFERGW